jgi:hypothetical protein
VEKEKVGWAACGKRRRDAEPGCKGKGGRREKVFKFQNPLKQMNSTKDLNSNTQNNAPACMQQ